MECPICSEFLTLLTLWEVESRFIFLISLQICEVWSLLSGRLEREKVGTAIRSAVQSQVLNLLKLMSVATDRVLVYTNLTTNLMNVIM